MYEIMTASVPLTELGGEQLHYEYEANIPRLNGALNKRLLKLTSQEHLGKAQVVSHNLLVLGNAVVITLLVHHP